MDQDKISRLVNTEFKENDLLKKFDSNYQNFASALALVFEIDPEIMYNISNLDYIWMPEKEIYHGIHLNYIQALTVPD